MMLLTFRPGAAQQPIVGALLYYGARIVMGLALNDHAMLLAGAIPAAAMALLIELGFRYGERWLLPASLRPTVNA